jgi:hypothetical protein
MNTVTLRVASLHEVKHRAREAFKGKKQGDHISFAMAELLLRVLTVMRWQLLRVLLGAGSMAVREAARRVDRDVKAVRSDIHALLNAASCKTLTMDSWSFLMTLSTWMRYCPPLPNKKPRSEPGGFHRWVSLQ